MCKKYNNIAFKYYFYNEVFLMKTLIKNKIIIINYLLKELYVQYDNYYK